MRAFGCFSVLAALIMAVYFVMGSSNKDILQPTLLRSLTLGSLKAAKENCVQRFTKFDGNMSLSCSSQNMQMSKLKHFGLVPDYDTDDLYFTKNGDAFKNDYCGAPENLNLTKNGLNCTRDFLD